MPDFNLTPVGRDGARALFAILDQPKRIRRPFADDDERQYDTIPADGVVDREELPTRTFDAIDRLILSDGKVTQAELEAAVSRLGAADQEALKAQTEQLKSRSGDFGKRLVMGFGGFGLGMAGLAAGAILGGTLGGALLVAGGLGIVGGFGSLIWNFVAGARESKQVFDKLDTLLSRANFG
jgi:hypothetical protein